MVTSNWKPADAGDPFVRIEIFEPAQDPRTFVSDFGTLFIKVRVQAVWQHRDDPSVHVAWPGWQGITNLRLGIARGVQRWTGTGWATPAGGSTILFDPRDFGGVNTAVNGVDGGIAVESECSFRAVDLGPGNFVLEVRAEGHPRNSPQRAARTGDWRPRVTRTRQRGFIVDGNPPDTEARVWDLNVPLVTGKVIDVGAGPRRVELNVKDVHTGKMWDETLKQWSTSWQDFMVDTDAEGNWYWHFHEEEDIGGGRYQITARGEDKATGTRGAWGNVDPSPVVTFANVSDQDPVISVVRPVQNETVGATGHFHGLASDDRALDRVDVTLRDLHTGRYWDDKNGAWAMWPRSTQADLELTTVNQTAQQWHYIWRWDFVEPPTGSGLYEFRVVARDTTGDYTGIAGVQIRGANDGIPPSAEITYPAAGMVLTGSPFGSNSQIQGTAEDDATGVASVLLSVQDLGTQSWWQHATGTWGPVRDEYPAEILYQPLDNDITWADYQFDPDVVNRPGSGSYEAHAVPVDGNGNRGQEVTVTFQINHVTS